MQNVYDFDGTIFTGDTEYCFYQYALTLDELSEETKNTIRGFFSLSLQEFFDHAHESYHFFNKLKNLDAIIEDFWDKHICFIKEYYLKQQLPNDIISSASPEFLIIPIMKRLGITRFMASPYDGNHKMIYHNCRDVKVRTFNENYPNTIIDNFYSDSDFDLPLARLAKHAFKVTDEGVFPWDVK